MYFLFFQLVSSFQLEATAKQQEAEQARNKLSSVRKMIAKLLKSINEVSCEKNYFEKRDKRKILEMNMCMSVSHLSLTSSNLFLKVVEKL